MPDLPPLMTFSHGAEAVASRRLVCPVHGEDVDRLMTEGGPRCAALVPPGRYCGEPLHRTDEARTRSNDREDA